MVGPRRRHTYALTQSPPSILCVYHIFTARSLLRFPCIVVASKIDRMSMLFLAWFHLAIRVVLSVRATESNGHTSPPSSQRTHIHIIIPLVSSCLPTTPPYVHTHSFTKLLVGDPEPFVFMYTIGNLISIGSSCFLSGPWSQVGNEMKRVRPEGLISHS